MDTRTNRLLIITVFAGGPHTRARVHLARELLRAHEPAVVFLAGKEFPGNNLEPARIAVKHFPDLPSKTVIVTDASVTTVESCLFVVRAILNRFPRYATLMLVTSNYHAPRAHWLLRGLLPRRYSLEIRTCPDVRWKNLRSSKLARKLILGEIISWLYCFPLGLVFRLLPVSVALPAVSLAIRARSKTVGSSKTIENPPKSGS